MSHVMKYLTDDGLAPDGTNESMVVSTATDFYRGPAEGKVWYIERALFYIEDATATLSTYGGISALTNGCGFKVRSGGVNGQEELDLLDGHPIKKNGDFGAVCYDVAINGPGSGNNMVLVRWTFGKAGAPLKLQGAKNQVLVWEINDSMTGLVEAHVVILGLEDND